METFVVRVWRPGIVPEESGGPDHEPGQNVIRGVLEHPMSGRTQPFDSGAHLLEMIAAWRSSEIAEPAGTPPSDG